MNVAVFSTKSYDRRFLDAANEEHQHQLEYFEPQLTRSTAPLAQGFEAVCVFVNDQLDAATLERLRDGGTTVVALRCAGFNNVDLEAAGRFGLQVVRVPAYSPYAVAEHTAALLLALNRKIHRAHNRVREGNFSLEGLLGFDLHGRTVGVIGTGRIGAIFANIMLGFGCRVNAYDAYPKAECEAAGITYLDLPELFATSHIISLHCPLTPETHHLINAEAIGQMQKGVMILNTSRGALIDAAAVVEGLKDKQVGAVGLDVYEEEADLFFKDLSGQVIQDDVFARLMTFPNVLITGHQAFFTSTAMENIAATTLSNITAIEETGSCDNAVSADVLR